MTSTSSSSRKRSGRSSDQGAAPVINIAHKRERQAVLGLKRERVTEVINLINIYSGAYPVIALP